MKTSRVARPRASSCVAVLGCMLLAGGCQGDPAGVQDRFPEAPPHGIDPAALARVYAQAEGIPGLQGLLVQRHGILVAEEYFHGFERDSSPPPSYSTRRPLVSTSGYSPVKSFSWIDL